MPSERLDPFGPNSPTSMFCYRSVRDTKALHAGPLLQPSLSCNARRLSFWGLPCDACDGELHSFQPLGSQVSQAILPFAHRESPGSAHVCHQWAHVAVPVLSLHA